MAQQRPIVVVEDDSVILMLMCDALESQGFSTIGLGRPEHVAQMLDGVEPAMLLIDIMLPEMDGFQLARKLRAGCFPQTPMVAMSASPYIVDAARKTDLFQEVLAKPFDLDELLATVHHYLADSSPVETRRKASQHQ